jgi:hypothetical protein
MLIEERFSRLLAQTCLIGCLLGGVATFYFLFGLAGYIESAPLNFAVVIALAAALGFVLYQFSISARKTGWVGWSIWTALLIIFIAEFLLGFLPPLSRDELTHHLAIPKLYVKAGRIIEVPMAPYAYYPMLVDMLFTPWVYFGYDFVPKWIHALYGQATGLLLYAYLAQRMNPIYGLLGWLFFSSTPVVLRLSQWGYVDIALAFYTSAALLSLIQWREVRDSNRWLALAGLSLGFALATKPNGMVAALLMGLLFLLIVVKPPRRSFRVTAREIIGLVAFTLLPFLPWLIKNWAQTGNPLFPFFASWFGGRLAANAMAQEAASFAGLSILDKRELLFGESVWDIAALPLRIFFTGRDDNPQLFDGVLTPVLILFLPWAFKGKWLEDKKLLGCFSLLLLLFACFLVDMRIRYILPIVPPLVVLLVFGVFNLYTRIKQPTFLFCGLIAFAAWHGSYLWRYVAEAEPIGFLSGNISRTQYLSDNLPEYAAFQYINNETSAGAKIYLLFIGRRAYYCERNYFHDAGDLPGFLLAVVRAAKSGKEISRALAQKEITHLLAREDLLAKFLANNLQPEQGRVWNAFAERGLKLKFRARGYAVYQLNE